MIHNQEVNDDLQGRGIRFIMDTEGQQFIPWEDIRQEDVVIIPAFGTTVEIERLLTEKGVEVQQYNTTCPFVEKVWNRAEKLGAEKYTIIIHGKPKHEETRATFSHSAQGAPSVIVRDMEASQLLGAFILGQRRKQDFLKDFEGKLSEGFDPGRDLQRVGVVNQTTMLATETQAIADYFRDVMVRKFGAENIKLHFADTRDTLCYATNDNQEATYMLLDTSADLALVVGGYNSSNTSHIAELCARRFPTYFINSETEIKSSAEIHHYDYPGKKKIITPDFLPSRDPLKIVLTSGASCPDTVVDRVMMRILDFFPSAKPVEEVMRSITSP